MHENLYRAVSQAAPLRSVRVSGDLVLSEPPLYASGGFAANVMLVTPKYCFKAVLEGKPFVKELGGSCSLLIAH